MRKFLFLILVFGIAAFSLNGQSLRAYERAGDKAMKNKDYGAATEYYGHVLQKHSEDSGVQWKYAECARLLYALPAAEKAYREVEKLKGKHAREEFPLLDLRLGEVKMNAGDYAGAASQFEKFLAEKPQGASAEMLEKALHDLDNCRWAQGQLASAKPQITITHPGKEINGPFSDFAPAMVGDTLWYSSYRFDKKRSTQLPKPKLTRVMQSIKNGRAREPGRNFPAGDSVHVAHTAFTPDGNFVFFTLCKNKNAGEIRCELWHSFRDKRGRWVSPMRLPAPINLPNYTTTQPNVGYDATAKGPVLWFASNRPSPDSSGGGLDLWYVPLDTVWYCPCTLLDGPKKMKRPPEFKQPAYAAGLNTSANEGTPFFFGPTQTLWFSTDGERPGFGGYDIYKSQKKGTAFTAPENAGAGLNTSYNDLYFFLQPDGSSGYLSSNRPGSYYLDESNKACCNDLFAFRLPQPEQPPKLPKDSLAPIPPLTPAITLTPRAPTPPLVPVKLQDFVGLPLYFDNDEPDKRTQRTATKKNYEETVLPYLDREEEYKTRFSEALKGEAAEKAIEQVEDFFENHIRRGYERLSQLAELLQVRLESGEQVEIFIKGFTSPRARSDYNINLGKRRISSVRNYFEVWNEGALRPFMLTGKLKVTETSFGETTARAGISDNLKDERNSIYHPDAARERRVEIVEIKQ